MTGAERTLLIAVAEAIVCGPSVVTRRRVELALDAVVKSQLTAPKEQD